MEVLDKYWDGNPDNFKSFLFNQINEQEKNILIGSNEICKMLDMIGYGKIDNVKASTVMHNKLSEISGFFSRRGLSLYACSFSYDSKNISIPVFSRAIVVNLFDIYTNVINKYTDFYKRVNNIYEKKVLESDNLLNALKVLIFGSDSVKLVLSEDERKEINSLRKNYLDEVEKLFKYEIDDAIVSFLVIELLSVGDVNYNYDGVIEEEVAPVLRMLGLEDLLPKLRESLVSECTRRGLDYDIDAWFSKEGKIYSRKKKFL